MSEKTLCKVSVENGDLYVLVTAWEDGNAGFDIALTDTENAWSGTVAEDDLGYLAKKMKVNFDSFISETRKALSRKNVGNLNFEYSLKEVGDDYVFSWKKYLPNDKIRIQLGKVKVTLLDETTDTFKEMLEQSIQADLTSQKNINSLESDNQRLSAERAGALKRLEKAVASKEDMENDLYSKFVVVVNDKKRKIRELRDELEDVRNGLPSTSSGSGDKKSSQTNNTSRKRQKETEISEDDDESNNEGHGSDYDTDEEKELQTKNAPSPVKKSKAKVKETLDTSDDLCLDLGGDDDSSPVAATRRRGRKGTAKKTPSKPIIPKVASSEQKSKTQGGKGRPSMKKSDSHTSNISNTSSRKSSDPSADDLLADL